MNLYFSFNSVHHPSEWLPQSLHIQSSASPLFPFVFFFLDTNRIHEEETMSQASLKQSQANLHDDHFLYLLRRITESTALK